MLHVDAHFARGHGHTVCQDYAVTGAHRAVVSDGCSGAPHSDVGARLLAHAALSATHEELRGGAWLDAPRRAQRGMGLPDACLDATVLIASARDDAIGVMMFGDGVVAARRSESGDLTLIDVHFSEAAPPYPSYGLCPARARAYDAAGLGRPRIDASPDAPSPGHLGAGLTWTFPRADWSAVLIGSDGLSAFVDGRQGVAPTQTVVESLFRYRSPRGAFVTRRLRKYLTKEAPARGLHPHDDVAVAALCWESP